MDNRDQPSSSQYAVAKIAGIKMCQAYRRRYGFNAICAMLTNFYGSGDNFDLETSHVLPAALIRKFHEAKESGAPTVTVWGTGNPRCGFLHVGDFATDKPDGTLRKLLDTGCLTGFGCQPAVGLSEGARETYSWHEKHAPDGQRSVRSTLRWLHA